MQGGKLHVINVLSAANVWSSRAPRNPTPMTIGALMRRSALSKSVLS